MTTIQYHTAMPSPVGELGLRATDRGLIGIFMEEHRHLPGGNTLADAPGRQAHLSEARSQLTEYFAGTRTQFDLAFDPDAMGGTAFQRRVWTALLDIPYGETISYGELARRIGQPTAVRAVGLANGRNPLSIVVPCHRVIGASGALTGYGGGLPRKRILLELEASHRSAVTSRPAAQGEFSLLVK